MSLLHNSNAIDAGVSYNIERSLRFNSADSAYLNRTPASVGNRKTWTWSAWIKRGKLGAIQVILCSSDSAVRQWVGFNSDDTIIWQHTNSPSISTSAVYRDPSAWYHLTLVWDTTQAQTGLNASDSRMRIYINGVQQTVTGTMVSQNQDGEINNTTATYHGVLNTYGLYYLDGYMTEINFINGQALTPSSFGEYNATTGVWQPKKYTGTYGTNGFYLNFSDNSGTTSTTLGKDYSGNGNNWTPNNFSVTAGAGNDSLVDTPTNYGTDTGAGGEVRGNYATWNSVGPPGQSSGKATFSNGNLNARFATFDTYKSAYCTFQIPPSTGKWYYEVQYVGTSLSSQNDLIFFGLSSEPYWNTNSNGVHAYIYWRPNTGVRGWFSSGGNTGNVMPNLSNGDILQIAYDSDTGKVYYGVNNTWYNSSGTGGSFSLSNQVVTIATTAALIPRADAQNYEITPVDWILNAGQRPFAYTAPSGFKALCTQNLPTPSINKGSLYFDATLRTGTGASASVSSLNFQPDLVWIKSRSAATNHNLFDSSRGATVGIITIGSVAEYTDANSLTAFNSNGYTLGSDASSRGVNINTNTYVDWVWKKSATPGFDIVLYTGNATNRTISHSLGAAPVFMAVKARSGSPMDEWFNYHQSLGPTKYIRWGSNLGAYTSSGYWNNTAPTSSVFSLGTISSINANGVPFVAYLWSEIAGFSRFGSFTGNGSSDGPFVFTGFRPRWVMVKRTDAVAAWPMYNSAINPYNVTDLRLSANEIGDEFTSAFKLDLVSNGFKIRSSDTDGNASGGTYIYAAFAENPFKYALAR